MIEPLNSNCSARALHKKSPMGDEHWVAGRVEASGRAACKNNHESSSGRWKCCVTQIPASKENQISMCEKLKNKEIKKKQQQNEQKIDIQIKPKK